MVAISLNVVVCCCCDHKSSMLVMLVVVELAGLDSVLCNYERSGQLVDNGGTQLVVVVVALAVVDAVVECFDVVDSNLISNFGHSSVDLVVSDDDDCLSAVAVVESCGAVRDELR